MPLRLVCLRPGPRHHPSSPRISLYALPKRLLLMSSVLMEPASSLIVSALHCGMPLFVKLCVNNPQTSYFTAGIPSPRMVIIRFFSGFFFPGSM